MAGKWEQFKKDFNAGYERNTQAFNVSSINTGVSNIIADWNRVDAGPLLVNGVQIKTLLQQDRGLATAPKSGALFKNEDELKAFFIKHLLKDVSAGEKDLMLDQMMTLLHQGALQSPVSGAAAMYLSSKSKNEIIACGPKDYDVGEDKLVKGQVRALHFKSTPTGFTVNEEVTQNIMYVSEGEHYISPDAPKDKPYIYKAEAEISVDFSKDPSSPQIRIEKNTIDFGNKQIESLFDDRNFLQKFIDGILVALGFKTIEVEPKNEKIANPNPDDDSTSTPLMNK